jgi:hypothetical protein
MELPITFILVVVDYHRGNATAMDDDRIAQFTELLIAAMGPMQKRSHGNDQSGACVKGSRNGQSYTARLRKRSA